jgi:hypothetical protein
MLSEAEVHALMGAEISLYPTAIVHMRVPPKEVETAPDSDALDQIP